jgi:DNA adenine methylase
MPYKIKKEKQGYKVCKKLDPKICFSKQPLPLTRAKKQLKAIGISENRKKLVGGFTFQERQDFLQNVNGLDLRFLNAVPQPEMAQAILNQVDNNNNLFLPDGLNQQQIDEFNFNVNHISTQFQNNPHLLLQIIGEIQAELQFLMNNPEDNLPVEEVITPPQTPPTTPRQLPQGRILFEEKKEGDGKPIIGRIGGKSLLKKIIVNSYFPENYEDMIYVEPFVGGGSIFFYKNKSRKEIINDLDKDVYNIYKGFQLYDGSKISKSINGTYNKEMFEKIKNSKPRTDYEKFIRLLILFRTSFFTKGESFSVGREKINSNFGDYYKNRLDNVTILNEDYKKVIKNYDTPNTFFYLDPPYEKSEGLYTYDEVNLNELYNILKNTKGKWLLSYNNSEEAKKLFKNFYINQVTTQYTHPLKGGMPRKTIELLISNYQPERDEKSDLEGNGKFKKLKFTTQLKSLGIKPSDYLKIAKYNAELKGYNKNLLTISKDGIHKLDYNGIKFGRTGYNDFILYLFYVNRRNLPVSYAFDKRKNYRKRAKKVMEQTKDKFSPASLSFQILW